MPDPITLRRLGPDDLDLLLSVEPGLFDNAPDPEQSRAFLVDPRSEIVLAFDGPLAVSFASGTILLHPDKPPAMFINEIATRDSHRRRGLAFAVTERLIAIARDRGCKGIWLGTEAENQEAQALYRKLGGAELAGFYYGWDGAF